MDVVVVDGDCDVFVVVSAVVAAAVIGSTWRQCCCVGGRSAICFTQCGFEFVCRRFVSSVTIIMELQ